VARPGHDRRDWHGQWLNGANRHAVRLASDGGDERAIDANTVRTLRCRRLTILDVQCFAKPHEKRLWVTSIDRRGQGSITRNEGVPGSSPGVGFTFPTRPRSVFAGERAHPVAV
jgi:hypothetical protein